MNYIAFAVGIAAVTLYLLGYLQKKRMNIILLNASSRFLYIVQYALLGAFEGAALDIAGIVSSLLAPLKKYGFVRKYTVWFVVVLDAVIVAVGLSLYQDIFSLFPIIGVLLHTGAFWMDDEKWIRRVSMAGSPFWLIYNFVSGAYGSCIGDVLSMVSIGISMVRYDLKKEK